MLKFRDIKELDEVVFSKEFRELAYEKVKEGHKELFYENDAKEMFRDIFLDKGVVVYSELDDTLDKMDISFYQHFEKLDGYKIKITSCSYDKRKYVFSVLGGVTIDLSGDEVQLIDKHISFSNELMEGVRANPERYYKETVFDFVVCWAQLLSMIDSRPVIEVERTEVKRASIGGKQVPTKKKSVVNINNGLVRYTTTDTRKANRLVKGGYARHAEAWSVRGHKRTYKSGKVVWIEPFEKGKGRKISKIYIAETEKPQ